MAAGWGAAAGGVQLRLRAELLQPDDGAAGVGVGHHLPAARRRRRLVRQLAPRRPPCHRRPKVHPLQGPHGLRFRDKNVLHHLVPAVHHPASQKHGLHSTRRKGTQGDPRGVQEQPLPGEATVVHRRDRLRLLRLRLLRADDFSHEELAGHVGRTDSHLRRRPPRHPNQRWKIEQAEGLQCPWHPSGEGVRGVRRRGGDSGVQHHRASAGDPVDAAEAGGVEHAARAAAAVHGGRGGVLRHQRGRLLGVRGRRVGVPPQPGQWAQLGHRPHQRHRLPSEHRLAAPVHGADTRGAGHADAEAGRGDVLAVQPREAAAGEGARLRGERVHHCALPVHGRLRQPLRLLRALSAYLHVPQHGRPQDQREGRSWEMEQDLALVHHRPLLRSQRRHHHRRRPSHRPQRQALPFLRGHQII